MARYFSWWLIVFKAMTNGFVATIGGSSGSKCMNVNKLSRIKK